MMEKPLAVNLADARAIAAAAKKGGIQVFVNYETTWYASNHAAHDLLLGQRAIGDVRKIVVHDGHQGPAAIGCSPDFLKWLTDPVLNGGGALMDFGCYGADLVTWLMDGQRPTSVFAVTQHIQPDVYPKVDDEATIVITYPRAQAILQASWNWPYGRKDMEIYGEKGSIIVPDRNSLRIRMGDGPGSTVVAPALQGPYADEISYLAAVVRGEIRPEGLSSLDTNLVVDEILDAARESARTGRRIDFTPRTPVVLVTDIGTDIDDAWALAYLLRSPELDLKLVLTDPPDTQYRARVAGKFLEAAGRGDVPVGIGDNHGPTGDSLKTVSAWIAGYDLSRYPGPVYQDGIGALISTVEGSAQPVTIIAIGPVPSLAEAVKRDPGLAAKCRFVGMFGSFDKGYGGGPPSAESNVKVDPADLRTVLAAPWQDILLTPLDTCGFVGLSGARYHAIWCATDDPMLRALIESYCIFAQNQTWMKCDFFATSSTTLFDCAAVYLAYSEALVDTETVSFDITDDGYTRRSANGPFKARVALRWKNLDSFEGELASRVLGR
jgi:predicted dehydrogenase/inosine-uridine nucleoside N-ribohydrolase